MKNKLKILWFSLYGECIKLVIRLGLLPVAQGINDKPYDEELIVSLTSYGRRVSDVLPYTIHSLLRQTYKPNKILLWLDSDHWNDGNLPKALKRLVSYGLTIGYCDDMKSYKKLIPTLNTHPNGIIITVDDDLYYPRDFIANLVNAHQKEPLKVHAYLVHHIKFDNEGNLCPYNNWEFDVRKNTNSVNFATSGGGCIFIKKHFYEDICNSSIFSKLSPKADDVWFFFMEYLKGTKVAVVPTKNEIVPLDVFYQKIHKNSCLSDCNCGESQNDVQIKAVIDYYNIRLEDLANYNALT